MATADWQGNKVRARDASLVGEVEDEASVAEVRAADFLSEGRVRVVVGSLERVFRDLAVLATQITNLAGLGVLGVASRILPALERVEVSQRLGAVAVLGNGVDVQVVGCKLG